MNQQNQFLQFIKSDQLSKWINGTWRVQLVIIFIFSFLQINPPQSALAETLPIITTNGSMVLFNSTVGNNSLEQTYTVSAIGLTEPITISAPTDFEVSLTSEEGFDSTLTLSPDENGTISETIIFVRLNPSSILEYNSSIIHTSGDAVPVGMPVIGSSIPEIQTDGLFTEFTALVNTCSVEQNYIISATNLTEDLLIEAPAGFELSLTSGNEFTNQLTLFPDAQGSIPETIIYVHLFSNLPGTQSGILTHVSENADPIYLPVNGTSIEASTETEETIPTSEPTAVTTPEAEETETPDISIQEVSTTTSLVASKDTWLNANYALRNYGKSTTLHANEYASGQENVLLQWDLDSIPANAVVQSASITLNTDEGDEFFYKLFALRHDWVEGDNTGAIGTGASWLYYDAGENQWGAEGASDSLIDRFDTNLWNYETDDDDIPYINSGNSTIPLTSAGIQVVQNWIADPSSNYGFTIQYTGTNDRYASWTMYSSEETDETRKPKLNITYTNPISGPTITVNSQVTEFITSADSPSSEQSYEVVGNSLTGDITVTAPGDFELSITSGGPYSASITLPSSGGTVYVQFDRPTNGTSTGNISHSSDGAENVDLPVQGTASTPELSVTGTIFPIMSTEGHDSYSSQKFLVNGRYLINNVIITAPSNLSLYSNNDLDEVEETITLSPKNSLIENEVIHVYANQANVGEYTDNIVISSSGFEDQLLPVRLTTYEWIKFNDCVKTDKYYDDTDIECYYSGSGTLVNMDPPKSDIILTVARSGIINPLDIGIAPKNGTDAYSTLDLDESSIGNIGLSSGSTLLLTFSGLDINKTYTFITSANANDPSKSDYLTDFTILDIDNSVITNSSTSGSTITTSTITNDTTTFSTGYNTENGYVARWTGIEPGADGDFSILFNVPGTYGYGPSEFILASEGYTKPTILVDSSMTDFKSQPGIPSVPQSYTVSGNHLINSLIIDPSDGFEISTDGVNFSSNSISLTPEDGSISTTTIYVRLNSLVEESVNGNITHNSTGASDKLVDVTGSVVTTPLFYVNGDITQFFASAGYGSAVQNITIYGRLLTDNVVITAPEGFQVSANSESGFDTSTTLIPESGSLTDVPVYIRLYNENSNYYSGDINISSTGADNETLPVYGTVFNWRAYNDCYSTDSSNPANTNTIICNSTSNTALNDFDRGSIVASVKTGGVNNINMSPNGSMPDTGTEAYNVFNGYANLAGSLRIQSDSSMSLIFSGLKSSKTYTFITTANYGDETTASSLTQMTISDIANNSIINESSNGTDISTSDILNDTTMFPAGYNSENGYITYWSGIKPGSDGDFTVTFYAMDEIAYGPSVFMLAEEGASNPEISTSGELTNFTALPESPSSTQSFSVSGIALNDLITIDPPDGYELSTDRINFSSTNVTLAPIDGIVDTTTVYVRLFSSLEKSFNGDITISSSGAVTKYISLEGKVTYSYTLSINSGIGGNVWVSPDDETYPAGTKVWISATADDGYIFNNWSGSENSDDHALYIIMDTNKTISANFIPVTCTSTIIGVSEDTYIDSVNPDYNYGGTTELRMNSHDEAHTAALLKWDVSSIPQNAIIEYSYIRWNVISPSSDYYYLYNLRRPWVEGTSITGTSSLDSANWNTYDGINAWKSAGAENTYYDRYDKNLWSINNETFTYDDELHIKLNDSGLSVIKGWIDGSIPNYGLVVQNYSTSPGADKLIVNSSESTDYPCQNDQTPCKPSLDVHYCTISSAYITVDANIQPFTAASGFSSAIQEYTIKGFNLTEDIIITPPTGFQISITENDENFTNNSLALSPIDGSVEETTIYVRMSNESLGEISGSITHTSNGAAEVQIPISGKTSLMYTLTINPTSNGTIIAEPGGGIYSEGTIVTLKAVPNANYGFSSWSGDVSNENNPISITMDGNKEISASFTHKLCYEVTLPVIKDTMLSSSIPTKNYGAEPELTARADYSSSMSALLTWDTSAIPENATIENAGIILHVNSGDGPISLFDMKRNWVEGNGTSDKSSTISSANWNTYDGIHRWSTNGAQGTLDRGQIDLWDADTSLLDIENQDTTIPMNQDGINILQNWVNGTEENYGFTIQATDTSNNYLWFYSSENEYADYLPRLTVDYCVDITGPAIFTSENLSEFYSTIDQPSKVQTFEVSGINLVNDIVISAPEDFTISLSNEDGSFGSSVTLPNNSGSVDSTTVYIRFRKNTQDITNGNITITSEGATDASITVKGIVSNSSPVIHLESPIDNSSASSTSTTLKANFTDPENDSMSVSIFGRQITDEPEDDFTIIYLPDSGGYANSLYADSIYKKQMEWIVENKESLNIIFVVSTGDLVDTSTSPVEYGYADSAFQILDDNNIPYSVSPGDQDSLTDSLYQNFFDISRFKDNAVEFFCSDYDLTQYDSSYSLFSSSGMDFLLVNLQNNPVSALECTFDILSQYPDRRILVASHTILDDDNSILNNSIYNRLSDWDRIFLMLSTQESSSSDGAGYLSDQSNYREQPLQIIHANYQAIPGSGYLRILHFYPSRDLISMSTYSPNLDQSIETYPNKMDMFYDMDSYQPYTLLKSVDVVTSGTEISTQWTDLAEGSEYEWYALASDGHTSSFSPVWSFTASNSPDNQAPIITEGDTTSVSMSEDGTPTSFNLTLNATDGDGDIVIWSLLSSPSHGSALVDGNDYAQIVNYTPEANYYGSDSFIVQVSDGQDIDTITVNVSIAAVNDMPSANAQTVSNLDDIYVAITLTGDDADQDPITFSIVTNPQHGVLSGNAPDLVFTPETDYIGSDSFTFTVSDGVYTSIPATVTINCLDKTPPSVTINQGSKQADPASGVSVYFDVKFSESVTGFDASDVLLTNSTVLGTLTVSITGSEDTYKVFVSGMASAGTVVAVIPAEAAQDSSGNLSEASSSTDNTVNYPKVYIPGQPIVNSSAKPTIGSTVSTLYPVIEWKASSPAAAYYELQISTNSSFSNIVIDELNIKDTAFTLATPLSHGNLYYWRIRGFSPADTNGIWSKTGNFKVYLEAPVLLLPESGESLLTDRTTFDWEEVDGATGYTIQASTASNFGSYLVNKTVTNSEFTTTSDLPQNRQVYWRVRASSKYVNSAWSNVDSFATGNPPSVPVLVSPANKSLTRDYTPKLDWKNSSNPSGTSFSRYQLQVSTNSDFTSMVFEAEIDGISNSYYIVPAEQTLDPNTTFYWRVRSVNMINEVSHYSAWSSVWYFRTALLSPTLVSPATGTEIESNRPTYNWENVTGAVSYTIQISRYSNFYINLLSKTITANEYTPSLTLPVAKTIYWRVRANGTNGPSAWSSGKFATPPSTPVLIKPAHKQTTNDLTPFFDWKDSAIAPGVGLGYYHIQVATDVAFNNRVIDVEDITVSNYTPSSDLDPLKTYYWRVCTVSAQDNSSSWSSVRYFKTTVESPTLISPASGAEVDTLRPTYGWSEIENDEYSITYTIQISRYSNFYIKLLSKTISTTEYTPSLTLPAAKTIYWRVRTNGPNGSSAWSTSSFATQPTTPVLVKPAHRSITTDLTPLFDWKNSTIAPITTFGYYQIQVDTNNDFLDTVIDERIEGDITLSSFTPVSDLPANSKYYWRVRTCTASEICSGWSGVRYFKTTLASPVLSSPAEASATSTRPTFEWVDNNKEGDATSFTIQISKYSNFSTKLLSKQVTGTSFSSTISLPAGRTIYWRVRANGGNGSSAWVSGNFVTQ